MTQHCFTEFDLRNRWDALFQTVIHVLMMTAEHKEGGGRYG